MTDYFALLDQPRRPWLDPDELKQAFHRKSLQTHPDIHAQTGDTAAPAAPAFAQLNEAYQVLQDPKRRLQHLLVLEGAFPGARSTTVPPQIEQLFPAVAAATQRAQATAEKNANATSPLTRSLLKPESLQAQKELENILSVLQEQHTKAVDRLRDLSGTWEQRDETTLAELHELLLRFSYLSRWMSELQEKQVALL